MQCLQFLSSWQCELVVVAWNLVSNTLNSVCETCFQWWLWYSMGTPFSSILCVFLCVLCDRCLCVLCTLMFLCVLCACVCVWVVMLTYLTETYLAPFSSQLNSRIFFLYGSSSNTCCNYLLNAHEICHLIVCMFLFLYFLIYNICILWKY